jgi:hypothetical protein
MEESLRFGQALPIGHESCRAVVGRVAEVSVMNTIDRIDPSTHFAL